jgi:peptide-methionine (R)-S-oxide reductase
MNRRQLLLNGTASAAFLTAAAVFWRSARVGEARAGTFAVTKTDAEWKQMLTPEQYSVLRHEATERPWTSPLLEEHRKGTFACAGCELPLYASETKFESGTGWPSFWESLPQSIGTREDSTLGMVRTECHCSRCGGHLGHIFDDGPPPTGKRHCINGLSLSFKPA